VERLEQVAHVEGFELTPSIFRVIELGQRNVVVLTPSASLPNTRDTHPSLREERVAAQTIPLYCDKAAGRSGVTYHTPALIEVGTHALELGVLYSPPFL
jgi:hypothetical protein